MRGQEGGREKRRPHLQDTDTSTRVAGMAALSWFKSPMPAVLVYRLSILGGDAVDLSRAHIQSSGRLRARSPAPDRRGQGLRVEAEEGGGGSSLDGGGSWKADLRAEPRGNRESVPPEAEAAGEVVHGAPGFPVPSLQATGPGRDTP